MGSQTRPNVAVVMTVGVAGLVGPAKGLPPEAPGCRCQPVSGQDSGGFACVVLSDVVQ